MLIVAAVGVLVQFAVVPAEQGDAVANALIDLGKAIIALVALGTAVTNYQNGRVTLKKSFINLGGHE
ncbi:MAG: hypothetical protein L0332_34590 [Chloroflexi bacterium]|nr:hypothetical protein [Chloroflexota bacterium]